MDTIPDELQQLILSNLPLQTQYTLSNLSKKYNKLYSTPLVREYGITFHLAKHYHNKYNPAKLHQSYELNYATLLINNLQPVGTVSCESMPYLAEPFVWTVDVEYANLSFEDTQLIIAVNSGYLSMVQHYRDMEYDLDFSSYHVLCSLCYRALALRRLDIAEIVGKLALMYPWKNVKTMYNTYMQNMFINNNIREVKWITSVLPDLKSELNTFDAVVFDSLESFQFCISMETDPKKQQLKHYLSCAIGASCMSRNHKVLFYILTHGERIVDSEEQFWYFRKACRCRNVSVTKFMSKKFTNMDLDKALFWALRYCQIHAVKQLLAAGANPNYKDGIVLKYMVYSKSVRRNMELLKAVLDVTDFNKTALVAALECSYTCRAENGFCVNVSLKISELLLAKLSKFEKLITHQTKYTSKK